MSGQETTGTPDEAQSEIDQILNEVEALRRELSGDEGTDLSDSLDSIDSPDSKDGEGESNTDAVPFSAAEGEAEGGDAEEVPLSDDDESLMKEFHAAFQESDVSEDQVGMEDTLADVPVDAADDLGKSLLDQTFEHHEEMTVMAEKTTLRSVPAAEAMTPHPTIREATVPTAAVTVTPAVTTAPLAKTALAAKPALHEVETPMPALPPARPAKHAATAQEATPGSLFLTLSGNMTLKLKYEFEGQEVTIGFAENCLKIELADGTELKVPVGKAAKPLRSAG